MRRVLLTVLLLPVVAVGEFLPALPALVPFITRAVSGVLEFLKFQNITDSLNALTEFVFKSTNQIYATVAAMWWAANEQFGAWGFVQRKAKDAGDGFTEIQQDQGDMWHHLYTRVLPHSLAHLEGKIGATSISPLHRDIEAVLKQSDAELRQINGILGWMKNYATPLLTGYQQFVKWWDANFAEPAATLIDWLRHPDNFAKWATPPLAGALVAYYADNAHKVTRDNLALIIADAFAEESGKVFDALMEWATTDT